MANRVTTLIPSCNPCCYPVDGVCCGSDSCCGESPVQAPFLTLIFIGFEEADNYVSFDAATPSTGWRMLDVIPDGWAGREFTLEIQPACCYLSTEYVDSVPNPPGPDQLWYFGIRYNFNIGNQGHRLVYVVTDAQLNTPCSPNNTYSYSRCGEGTTNHDAFNWQGGKWVCGPNQYNILAGEPLQLWKDGNDDWPIIQSGPNAGQESNAVWMLIQTPEYNVVECD